MRRRKTLQPQTVNGKSFSDRLAELEAKADRINADVNMRKAIRSATGTER